MDAWLPGDWASRSCALLAGRPGQVLFVALPANPHPHPTPYARCAGWQAWWEMYCERTRQQRMLAASAYRLARPKLVACYREWWQDWQAGVAETRRHEAMLARERRLSADAARLQEAEAEVKKLREELGWLRVSLAAAGDDSGLRRAMEEQVTTHRYVYVYVYVYV